jgi:hypothetical protein
LILLGLTNLINFGNQIFKDEIISRNMKRVSLSLIGLFLGILLFAQVPKIPFPFDPKSNADYEKVQPQAIDCMKWFINSPINKYKESFNYMYNFLFVWTAGIKSIPLSLDKGVVAPLLEEKNKPKTSYYMVAYLSGMLLYQLQHPTQSDQAALQLEGVRAVIKFYENNTDMLESSAAVNQYRELNNSGKLDSWVGEHLTRE